MVLGAIWPNDDQTMSLISVDEMVESVDRMRDSQIPDAAKIFAAVLNRLKDQVGEEDTIAFLGDFELKSLWTRRLILLVLD